MNEAINKLTIELFIKNPIFWIIIVLGLSAIFYKKIAGKAGEFWVKRELSKLDKQTYYVINDVTIQDNNSTHQIDHIVISQYGIFVIETKQYNGYIKGSKYDKKWVRYIKGKEPIYYTNPIRQNYGHVKAICELLNISENKVFNIVCIPSNNVKLNIEHDGELTTGLTINDKITSYNEEIIDNVEELKEKIIINNIVDKDIRKRHIERIKKVKEFYDDKTCPVCGSKLKLRIGKYGNFLGCTNYPKCKYTRKI